jgi:hypothetical protein
MVQVITTLKGNHAVNILREERRSHSKMITLSCCYNYDIGQDKYGVLKNVRGGQKHVNLKEGNVKPSITLTSSPLKDEITDQERYDEALTYRNAVTTEGTKINARANYYIRIDYPSLRAHPFPLQGEITDQERKDEALAYLYGVIKGKLMNFTINSKEFMVNSKEFITNSLEFKANSRGFITNSRDDRINSREFRVNSRDGKANSKDFRANSKDFRANSGKAKTKEKRLLTTGRHAKLISTSGNTDYIYVKNKKTKTRTKLFIYLFFLN